MRHKDLHGTKIKCRFAFTLIELLVVIAIIALLLAIMVPSLQIAKERARRLVCGTRIKNWAVSLNLFAENNDGKFETDTPFAGGGAAQDVPVPFLNTIHDDYDMSAEMMFCPSWNTPSTREATVNAVEEILSDESLSDMQYNNGSGWIIMGYNLWTPRHHAGGFQIPPHPTPPERDRWPELNPKYDSSWVGPRSLQDRTVSTVPVMNDRAATMDQEFTTWDVQLDPDYIWTAFTSHYNKKLGIELNNQVYADTHVETKKNDELLWIYGWGDGIGQWR